MAAANYSVFNENSKLCAASRTFTDKEKKWNEVLNRNAPILHDILARSQTKASALQLEEERYKLKKRARLEKERADKEANQKLTEQLHAFANKLAQITLDEEFEAEEDEFPGEICTFISGIILIQLIFLKRIHLNSDKFRSN